MKKVILFGAGPRKERPDLEDSLLVCCDGGYHYLKDIGREPDLLVGDFDTFPKDKIGNPKRIISLNPIKDDTDSFHAVDVLLKEGYTDFHLYGRYGGRRDQTLASLNLVSHLKDRGANSVLYSDDGKRKRVRIENEAILLSAKDHGFVSVFSYYKISQGVTIENRKYTLSEKELSFSTRIGCSNELIGKEGYIQVRKGRLIIVLPKEEEWKRTKIKSI